MYQHGVRVAACDPKGPPRAAVNEGRGEITGFSRKSRRRLIERMIRLQSDRLSKPLFLTLTYHHAHEADDHEPQENLNAFLQACRRRWPSMEYIWRIEPQERGAPHFHVILWLRRQNGDFDTRQARSWITETWHRLADPTSIDHLRHGVEVREVDSHRQASYYVSKYCAKEEGEDSWTYQGRRWGCSRSLPLKGEYTIWMSRDGAYRLRQLVRALMVERQGGESQWTKSLAEDDSHLIGLDPSEAVRLIRQVQSEGYEMWLDRPPPSGGLRHPAAKRIVDREASRAEWLRSLDKLARKCGGRPRRAGARA